MGCNIDAPHVQVDETSFIGDGVTIRGESILIGPGVRIADGVTILCDELVLGAECRISGDTQIICPKVQWAEGCSSGIGFRAELNEHIVLGRYSSIGARVAMSGQSVEAGEFLWLKDEVLIGGGGAKGPRSRLRIGDRTSVFDRSYINLSESVSMGSNSALSYNVVILTHGAWQPALQGYPTSFAPVAIGDFCVVYLNSVILPGVTIGDYSTIAAGAVVKSSVPDHCLAAGNPATVKRGPSDYPRPLSAEAARALVLEVLAEYATTLAPKGVLILEDRIRERGWLSVWYEDLEFWVGLEEQLPDAGARGRRIISLGFGSAGRPSAGDCHFDLRELVAEGPLCALAEDLRDFLRRRAIRIFTGKPFKTLPLANLARLRRRAPKDGP